MAARKPWTRDELLVALNLYHKLTFGQLHARHPAIVALAEKLGRGANSVAMKLCNLASLDPALKLRGIRGLEGASALDRTVWAEFHENLSEAAPASEAAFRNLFKADEQSEIEVLPREGVRLRRRPTGSTETTGNTKIRRGQEFFRQAVLNNFGGRCGVTGLGIRDLLIASHILPWGTHPAERLNVRNGLCLSRLHDAAFDCGLIAFDDELRLILSKRIKAELPQKIVSDSFGAYSGMRLQLPEDAALPQPEFLAIHRDGIFERGSA
jgi:predicted restriction endonuclease